MLYSTVILYFTFIVFKYYKQLSIKKREYFETGGY